MTRIRIWVLNHARRIVNFKLKMASDSEAKDSFKFWDVSYLD